MQKLGLYDLMVTDKNSLPRNMENSNGELDINDRIFNINDLTTKFSSWGHIMKPSSLK